MKMISTDLDGTLIPLQKTPEHLDALKAISKLTTCSSQLVFVTGRHLSSVLGAIVSEGLPKPTAIIADVGTSIYEKTELGWKMMEAYAHELEEKTKAFPYDELRKKMKDFDHLEDQEEERQAPFKASYFCDPQKTIDVSHAITSELAGLPYHVIGSVDPFENIGLIDILPKGISKYSALKWLIDFENIDANDVVFSGDSGNDLDVILSPDIKSICVSNMENKAKEKALVHLEQTGDHQRVLFASKDSTLGVVEGLQHFGFMA